MKRKIRYTDDQGEVVGRLKVIPDFLPSPQELASGMDHEKITLNVSRRSLNFFKSAARKTGVKYQRLMRAAIDSYVDAHRLKLRS
ncbi:MAG: CopG family transcriptional regulator [Verrucomicrobiota bacterium]